MGRHQSGLSTHNQPSARIPACIFHSLVTAVGSTGNKLLTILITLFKLCVLGFVAFVFADTDEIALQPEVALETQTSYAMSDELDVRTDRRVFTAEDFGHGFSDLADFLNSLTGIQVQQTGGLGNTVLVSIRGASALQTQVTLDGVPINSAQFGGYDLNQIPLSQLEQVELVTSGQSDQHLSSAIGGSIHLTTLKREAHAHAAVQAGRYQTYLGHISVPLNDHLLIQVDHQQSANDYIYPVPSPFNNSQATDRPEPVANNGFRKNSASLSYQTRTLNAQIRHQQQRKEQPNFSRNPPENSAELTLKSSSALLVHQYSWSEIYHTDWQLNVQNDQEQFNDPDAYIGLGSNKDRFTYRTYSAKTGAHIRQLHWQTGVVVQWQQYRFNSQFLDDDKSQQCVNILGQCDSQSERTTWQPSVYGHWSSDTFEHQINASSSLYRHHQTGQKSNQPTTKKEDRASFKNYRLSYRNQQWPLEWQLTYSDDIRVPSLYEQFGNHGLLLGNDDLQPESSRSTSLDIFYRIKSWTISSAAFRRELDNAIVPVYDSRGVGRYLNTTQASLNGFEWHIQWRSQALIQDIYFRAQASGTRYRSQARSPIASFDDQHLPGIYHLNHQWQLSLINKRHSAHLVLQKNDHIWIDRSNLVEGDPRKLVNLRYQYQRLNTHLTISVKNALDTQFNDFSNRPTQGRFWLVGLSHAF